MCDVGRHPLEEYPRAARDLVAHAGRELADVERRGELIAENGVRQVDRNRDVDQVVALLLLIARRRTLPAATAQPADQDPARELGHDLAGRHGADPGGGIEVAPYLADA